MNKLDCTNWNDFIDKLATLPENSPIPDIISSRLKSLKHAQNVCTPKIKNEKIIYGNKEMDLSSRKKMLNIFEFLLSKDNHSASRTELINTVYSKNYENLSERHKACCKHNIVKLISRARKFANKHLSTIDGITVEWFSYDPGYQKWKLYRYRY